MTASDEFRLSITRALADQLADGLARLVAAPLDMDQINGLRSRPGIYQLYEDGMLVYVGKAEASLRSRLAKHYHKLVGRENVGSMTFAALYVHEDLHAVAPERLLIDRYRAAGQAPWNNKGFGSNDPGQNRDETQFENDHFDSLHPARLDWVCNDIAAGTYSVSDLLERVKHTLPYTFRYQTARFHADLTVEISTDSPTSDQLFQAIGNTVAAYDDRWQITALPGYVIMYPRHGPYPSARKIYQ
ncbi:MAG TPA: Eco29kI family restriction endonuclease [Micromonosporaceae bacterium]|jgi:hypothetical protein|nr:Eco29kI family restriction endonuclease [Micromonosporaceae bacterium]